MMKLLWLKELHRLPPLPPGQTSPQRRYLTTNTNAAQRLRALVAYRLKPDKWDISADHFVGRNDRTRRNLPFMKPRTT
ncbi:MAG: hypothetical protein M3Y22_00385, partial [Pseudomonadota bacterium]|nr:hypothetical protein [Pseudomonadota bacterium]